MSTALEQVGVEARVYMVAGLDPLYRSEANLDLLVRSALHSGRRPRPAGDRARIAAEAIRSWVTHRPQPDILPPIAHRLMPDGTRLIVTTATPNEKEKAA